MRLMLKFKIIFLIFNNFNLFIVRIRKNSLGTIDCAIVSLTGQGYSLLKHKIQNLTENSGH